MDVLTLPKPARRKRAHIHYAEPVQSHARTYWLAALGLAVLGLAGLFLIQSPRLLRTGLQGSQASPAAALAVAPYGCPAVSLGDAAAPTDVAGTVGLFNLFEVAVSNDKKYTNAFDFTEIELQATFTAPSGEKYNFFGFHDGDGQGGQTGNVWKLRFMPHKTGTWTYTYCWTDGTPGGSGSFAVEDTGIPGPLRVAADNSWYFATARGAPFDARGYSLHQYLEGKYGLGMFGSAQWNDLRDKIIHKVAERDYNLLMLVWPVFGGGPENQFWYHDGAKLDFTRFEISQWREVEKTLEVAAEKRVYVFQFVAMVSQEVARPNHQEQTDLYLRYMAARLGPFWNNFGYSPTWEYQDIWSHDQANAVMARLHGNLAGLPLPPLLSIHDHSNEQFHGWLDFSMRQRQSRNVLAGNMHGGGIQGGVGKPFLDAPIIGSEDIWEYCDGSYSQPRNANEIRRGAWGIQMAGVMPIYNETGLNDGNAPCEGRSNFSGAGEPEVRRMFDFFYSRTRYRQYTQLNHLVSQADGQIASGIPNQEYLVYDENGGAIALDLAAAPSLTTFDVLWYDPAIGQATPGNKLSGGATVTLDSPISGDTVLFLRNPASVTAPSEPTPKPVSTKTPTPVPTEPKATPQPAAPAPANPTPDPAPTTADPSSSPRPLYLPLLSQGESD